MSVGTVLSILNLPSTPTTQNLHAGGRIVVIGQTQHSAIYIHKEEPDPSHSTIAEACSKNHSRQHTAHDLTKHLVGLVEWLKWQSV
jgi:hypothetical protein